MSEDLEAAVERVRNCLEGRSKWGGRADDIRLIFEHYEDIREAWTLEVRKFEAAEARATALEERVRGLADDYMTSEHHHPGYVLIPTAKFKELCGAELTATLPNAAGT
jgi:hypothetical protein